MTKRRILITGCRGLLGSELLNYLSKEYDIKGVDITDFDICDSLAVSDCIDSYLPEIVCHTSAYTDVDRAEKEKEKVEAINNFATENIAKACHKVKAKLIYYSTDYVFNGEKDTPYTEEDIPDPINFYGYSKLKGEQKVADILDDYIILRTAWLYGSRGKNFMRAIIKKGYQQIRSVQKGEIISPLKVVDDQIGNPTWTYDLACQTKVVIENSLKGLYHCKSNGETTWYGLTKAVFDILNMKVLIKPCKTEDYPHIAKRPKYSSLENRNLLNMGMDVMRDYEIALREFLNKQREILKNEI